MNVLGASMTASDGGFALRHTGFARVSGVTGTL